MSSATRMRTDYSSVRNRHRPDFGAPTPPERAQGITAKCEACGKALYRGVEFITVGCVGGPATR